MFLSHIPIKWPKLKSLILRDCTELEDEFVSSFAMSLAFGGCPSMSYIDCSCQWSFYNTSLLFKSVKDELNKLRGIFDNDNDWRINILTNNRSNDENDNNNSNSNDNNNNDINQYQSDINILHQEKTGISIRWREDQCEMNDYGVDPEDGVDIHSEIDNNGFHTSVMERLRSHSICSSSDITEHEHYNNNSKLHNDNHDIYDDDEEMK